MNHDFFNDDYYQDPTNEHLEAAYRGCFMSSLTMVLIITLVLICLALSSCTTTRYVQVPITKTDTLIVAYHQRDSVYLHDSISVRDKGDTIWVQEYHTKYKLCQVHDTTIAVTHDTIPQPVPVTEYVNKPLSVWQKTCITAGKVAILATLVGLLLLIYKITKK